MLILENLNNNYQLVEIVDIRNDNIAIVKYNGYKVAVNSSRLQPLQHGKDNCYQI